MKKRRDMSFTSIEWWLGEQTWRMREMNGKEMTIHSHLSLPPSVGCTSKAALGGSGARGPDTQVEGPRGKMAVVVRTNNG